MKYIILSKGYKCLVDSAIKESLLSQKWSASVKGPRVYAMATVNKKTIYLHRLLAEAKKGDYVDHINGDTLDCRISNLRICTNRENALNSKDRIRKSKYRNVVWHKRNKKWQAQIRVTSSKRKYLGQFISEMDAARAADKAALEYHGKFARFNF